MTYYKLLTPDREKSHFIQTKHYTSHPKEGDQKHCKTTVVRLCSHMESLMDDSLWLFK